MRGRGRSLFAAVVLLLTTVAFGVTADPASAAPGISGTVGAPTATTYGKTVTFTGTVDNTGADTVPPGDPSPEDFTSVTIVDDGSTGLTITSITPVGPLATDDPPATFTVTARITAAPGTQATLRLKATGVTASLADTNPQFDIDGASFTVTDAVVLTVTAERKQGTTYSPCVGTCTVSIDDGIRYTVKVENLSDAATTANVTITAPAPAETTDAGTSTIPTGDITLVSGVPQTFIREVTVNDPANDADPPQPGAVIAFPVSAVYDTTSPTVLTDRPAIGSPTTFFSTVVDPRLTITNVLTDTNGGQLVRGDAVGSTIAIENDGNSNATNTVIQATLTNLQNITDVRINGSLAGNKATVSGASNNVVTVRVGSGANNNSGGVVAAGGPPITVSFSATVVSNPTGDPAAAASTASVMFDNGGVSPKTASDSEVILGQPDISLVITPSPSSSTEVPRNGTITYTITATNAAGVADATGLQISFPTPAQTTFVSATTSTGGSGPTAPAVGSAGTVTTTFPTVVSGGAPVTLTVTVKVAANATQVADTVASPEPNDIVATARATFGPGTNNPVDATPVGHELSVAQLTLTNTMTDANAADPGGDQLLPGELVRTRITVDNVGGSNATDVVLAVTLTNLTAPTNVLVNGNPVPFTFSAGVLTVPVGSVVGPAATDGGTITPADAPFALTFDSTATARAPGQDGSRVAQTSAVATFDNGGNSPTNAQPAALPIEDKPSVSLLITATPAAPGPVDAGSTIEYQVKATNAPGVGNAKDVVVSFPIPANTTFVSASGGTGTTTPAVGGTGTVSSTFGNLNQNSSGTLTVVVRVLDDPNKAPGVFAAGDPTPAYLDPTPANDIIANASATYGPGTNPTVNAPAVAHEISAADLTLSISPITVDIQKKKPATVTATVRNLGPNPAEGSKTVTFQITSGVGVLQTDAAGCTPTTSTQLLTCTLSTDLNPNSSKAFTVNVQADDPATVEVTATLSTTNTPQLDLNPDNNIPVKSTITFRQSVTDISIEADAATLPLTLLQPTEEVTFTVRAQDPNSGANDRDDAENVTVKIDVLSPAVQATQVTITGAPNALPCVVPAGPGGSFTCTLGDMDDETEAEITVTFQGVSLLAVATPITATVSQSNIDDPPTNNKATVLVTVLPQEVDLAVSDGLVTETITTLSPSVTTATKAFTVTVTNNAVLYTAGSYTVSIQTDPAVDATQMVLTSGDAACAADGNGLLCTAEDLAPGGTREFLVSAEIKAPGGITIRSTVALAGPDQIQPATATASANNSDTWVLIRNIPPATVADIGPTVPPGSTLVFDVLNNDSDADNGGPGEVTDVLSVRLADPVTGAGALTVTLEGTKVKVAVPANQAPVPPFVLEYDVLDGRGGVTPSSLTVRVALLVIPPVEGSYGDPPTSPVSFGNTLTLGDSVNPLDLLAGPLGERASGTAFPTTPTDGDISYLLTAVDSIAVEGSEATVESAGAGSTRKVVSYVPAPGYTSSPPVRTGTDLADAPPDSFTYTGTGTRRVGTTDTVVFTVVNTVAVEVKNQNPIGLDTLITIDPSSTGVLVDPVDNDIDGNTVADTINVASNPPPPGNPFTFDDEGKKSPAHGLEIACIGPVPPLNEETRLPVAAPSLSTCDDSTMRDVGEQLSVTAFDQTGTITVVLNEDRRKVTVATDASVKGAVPFAAVVVDNYGGAAWSLVTIEIPNQPPEILPETQIVPKNSPPVVVLDTKNAVRDANGDVVKISAITDPANGRAEITDGGTTITYTPDTDFVGPDSLVLNVSDDAGVGSNRAQLNIEVVEAASQPEAEAAGAGGDLTGGGSPAGNLAATGGDPVPLTLAAAMSMTLGFALVQASRRRRSRPLLAGARHLRT